VVQQLAPALVGLGAAKALRMALEIVPPHQQQMPIVGFEAAPQLVTLVAGARGDDPLRLQKAGAEGLALAGADFEDRDFENDDGLLPYVLLQAASSSSTASPARIRPGVSTRA